MRNRDETSTRWPGPWRSAAFLLVALTVTGSSGAEPGPRRFEFAQNHMGTRFRIVFYADDDASAKTASDAAFARIAQLEQVMSDYRPDSELMRLCVVAGGEPIRVSEDLFAVLSRSGEMWKLSDGAFDVTAGPLTRLWRKTRKTQVLPAAGELAEARGRVGFDKVRLDAGARTVQLTAKGMLLDLGGIAKGYAVDEAARVLRKHGLTRTLVAGGGDIAVGDPPPDAPGWRVGVTPLEVDEDAKPTRFLLLRNAAVSTSGDSEQHTEIGGVRYSHIVDVKTGLGMTGRHSVTVVAPSAFTSDPLAKVVLFLGPDKGRAAVEGPDGTAALLVTRTDKGEEVVTSKRWKDFEAPAK
jgi:thiamine biosynthesis lipoprotein